MKIKTAKWVDSKRNVLRVVDDDDVVRFVPATGEGQYAKLLEEYTAVNTVEEEEVKAPKQTGLADLDVHLRALGLVLAQWCGKTPGQLKTAFKDTLDTLKG